MKRWLVVLLAVVAIAGAGIAAVSIAGARPAPDPDVAALNDAVRLAEDAWPSLTPGTFAGVPGEVSVLDANGRIAATTSETPPASALEAARRRSLAAPVVVEERVVATVYLVDGLAGSDASVRRDMALSATWAIVAVSVAVALLMVWLLLRVVRPFHALERFAARVAAGDLDAPLRMDRANVFGAWTESFDLLRSELADARRRERDTAESKKALVAQISHDVRTPVASIAATAELLRAGTSDPATIHRLDVVRAKAAQLDALVTDLARANADELAALPVVLDDVPSGELPDLVRGADFDGRASLGPIPGCLLRVDRARLAQVFDNIVGNSYKYAGTPIAVTARFAGPLLEVAFTDAGPGVGEDELGSIFARGVRGSNVGLAPGHGLGLFTSAWLMERMGGDIAATQDASGFTVTVGVPLA